MALTGIAPLVRERSRVRALALLVPTIAIPALLWFAPLHLEPRAQRSIAITVFMILGWATELMDHGLTGLIGCYLFWALGVARFDLLQGRAGREGAFGHNGHGQPPSTTGVVDIRAQLAQGAPHSGGRMVLRRHLRSSCY